MLINLIISWIIINIILGVTQLTQYLINKMICTLLKKTTKLIVKFHSVAVYTELQQHQFKKQIV